MKKKEYSLVGVDGNAYCLMGCTQEAMREQGFSKEEIDETMKEAMSGNYMHLVAVLNSKIYVCNERASKK